MQKFLLIILISLSVKILAQPLNNEWIDYSKTYYKFKVGYTGLYRIPQTSLANYQLQNVPAEQFQLWRNGKQVPLFITKTTGILGTLDYIEFWGEQNDGKADKYLYRDPNSQHSDRVSLQTDTAAFYLTVNPNSSASNPNLRFVAAANTIPSTPPTAEPYFIYKKQYDFKEILNRGYAQNVSEYLYSSTYDKGEFWSTIEIQSSNSPYLKPIGNLFAAPNGPDASIKAGFAANSDWNRKVTVGLDNNSGNLIYDSLYGFNSLITTNTKIAISKLTASPTSFSLSIVPDQGPLAPYDRAVCSFIELTYPRLFNFDGQTNFSFSLPAASKDYYLKISNFKYGSKNPVLYDITNNLRYEGDISLSGFIQLYLPSSSADRNFILVSEDATVNSIANINSLEQRNFINYGSAANQGDFLIISNKILGLSNGGAVDKYRQYRSANYNVKVCDIDELVDQFAYGIKKHPLSIKNFIRYATSSFSTRPKYAMIIGKGVVYDQYRANQSSPNADRLNLVPTWGWPASDALMFSGSMDPEPLLGIGRISAVSEQEVNDYLSKLKEYEAADNAPNTVASRQWRKQVIHVAGADDSGLNNLLIYYLGQYERIIKSPNYGGTVANFNKTTTGPVSSVANAYLNRLMSNVYGVGLITYFGHGSSTLLNYANLNDPLAFTNSGKYPVFLVNGCSVGNFFDFDEGRFTSFSSLAEKYIFAPSRGSISFIANSHFGLTDKLDFYTTGFYNSLDNAGYGDAISRNANDAIAELKSRSGAGFNEYLIRAQAEETIVAGDPALKVYSSAKPDFVVEQPDVVISPSIISVADSQFVVKVYLHNIGKFSSDSFVNVLVQRKYPDGTIDTFPYKLPNFGNQDSTIKITYKRSGTRDKGSNQIIVTIDNDQKIDEIDETNNNVTKSFAIFDNGITPIYPTKFAIVNKQNISLIASTANPIIGLNTYAMDIDTTELFNSPLKVTKTVSSIGGAISFDPGIQFQDSTVYYWRVARVASPTEMVYTTSSFVYLNNSSTGYNQSHIYQHLKSSADRIYLDSNSRTWTFLPDSNNIIIRQAIYPAFTEDDDYATVINGITGPLSACVGHSIIFNVYDPITLKPFYNQTIPATTQTGTLGGFMGSVNPPSANCTSNGRQYNFEFQLYDSSLTKAAANRKAASDFMNWIPNGYIVTARLNYDDPTPFADVWKADAAYYGNNTLYNNLKSIGFSDLDSFNKPRVFVLIYKKNTPSFQTQWKFSNGVKDAIYLNLNIASSDTLGFVTSPSFGPVTAWKRLKWNGINHDKKAGDKVNVSVIGLDKFGGNPTELLSSGVTDQDVDLTGIDAAKYPYIKLAMRNADSINVTPYQLRYWRLLADMIPEGGLAANVKVNLADTLQTGQILNATIAFKNISDVAFKDSIVVKMQIVDNSNVTNDIPIGKLKPLAPNDTATINYTIDAFKYIGNNTLFIDVNPDNNQPEQLHFNNYVYKNFVVIADDKKPVLDVTFDGVHILNNDVVSSKPAIRIKLKDDAKYLLLNDTSLITVQLINPDGSVRRFRFDTDTLRFTPANKGASENAAYVDFAPYLLEDGTYQLYVSGRDKTGNGAGSQEFRVKFKVLNKPTISNVFNYPNPFTTSTAFVFTLTGSEVPQNIKIQILTVTGKIVREITREELGNLHIGNNITSFKWDGTDSYGSKLGNGVYLYRVVTRLNGVAIDKYSDGSKTSNTDGFFKEGYGKMYLMR